MRRVLASYRRGRNSDRYESTDPGHRNAVLSLILGFGLDGIAIGYDGARSVLYALGLTISVSIGTPDGKPAAPHYDFATKAKVTACDRLAQPTCFKDAAPTVGQRQAERQATFGDFAATDPSAFFLALAGDRARRTFIEASQV
jgi:hypothetical protein